MGDLKDNDTHLTEFRLSLVEEQQKLDKAQNKILADTVSKLSTDLALVSSDLNRVLSFTKMILGGIVLAFVGALWKLVVKGGLGQ